MLKNLYYITHSRMDLKISMAIIAKEIDFVVNTRGMRIYIQLERSSYGEMFQNAGVMIRVS